MVKRVLIMAGGTGGHVFPAFAVAQALQKEGVEVHWLGTIKGMENQLLATTKIPIHQIAITGWRGKGWKKWLQSPFILLRTVYAACKIIRQANPNVVVGFGGFVSGPGGIAAKLCKKPLIIHEQNAIAGLTNKALAHIATIVMQAFPGSFNKQDKGVITVGNPVRTSILQLPPPEVRGVGQKPCARLLILGGSQGAQVINQIAPLALSMIPPSERPEIWHQTGKSEHAATQSRYRLLGLQAKVVPFIEDMAEGYHWADAVLCRAGALTISELAATGVASILVPYPHAVDNHQFFNAQHLARCKAAIIITQPNFTAARTAEILRKFLRDRSQLLKMAEIARGLRQENATEKVAEKCLELLSTKIDKSGSELAEKVNI